MNEEQKVELKLIHMEEVVSKEVSWLWYPYIPYGKITVIEGDPGEGKTTLVLKLAAMLSKGLPLPCDDDRPYEPIHIIYQTAEDGIDDTIKPRLEQNGADCSMIRVIDETEKELSMTDERLEQAIVETNAKLIILDPIQAYIGATVDMHRANEIRPVLKKLGMIAEKYQCAVILIGHMNKASGSKSTYRGLGSIDIQATARSVLLVARLRDKPNIRIMAQDKSSLAPAGDAIGFEMTEDRGMTCIGPYDITIDELLIALSLELFVNGSLNIFNHQTNVDVDNRFTVYGIRDLGTELSPITMLVMMESIQNRIVENGKRGKATWLYIDEFHVLLNSEYSAKYLQQLWKKVRKQGGLCTGITQNVIDLLQNYTATTMLANSEFVALLKQANTDSSKMAEVIGVSE